MIGPQCQRAPLLWDEIMMLIHSHDAFEQAKKEPNAIRAFRAGFGPNSTSISESRAAMSRRVILSNGKPCSGAHKNAGKLLGSGWEAASCFPVSDPD
jgi:hypothetical protein